MHSQKEEIKEFAAATFSAAVGVFVFVLSSLYWRNGTPKLSFDLFPQTALFFILGFLHAYNVYELENLVSRQKKGLFSLFCYFLVYAAWYNIVLLPESGLGYIEWFIVLFLLSSNIITEIFTKKINNPFMGQRPLVLVYMGIVLFVAKLFLFYMFPDNIYDSMILTKKTARSAVGIFSLFGIVVLVMQFYKHVTNKLKSEPITQKEDGIKKFFSSLGNLFMKLVKLIGQIIATFLSGPAILIIVIASGFVGLAYAFYKMNKIYDNIMAIIEPLLQKLASTGENHVHPSLPYYVCQLVSMCVVLFYTIHLEHNMEKNIDNAIKEEIRGITDGQPDGDKYFEKASKELLKKNFSEKIRLLNAGQSGVLNTNAEKEITETIKQIEVQNY